MRKQIEQAEAKVTEAEEAHQEVVKEIKKRREVETKWVKHAEQLEKQKEQLKKEIDEFYNVDRAAGYDFE